MYEATPIGIAPDGTVLHNMGVTPNHNDRVDGRTCSSRTPLFLASALMFPSPAGGNLSSHRTAFGTLRSTAIHVEKMAGSIL